MANPLDTFQNRPTTVFAAFLVFHAAVWTALPAALYPNLPLDLVEALAYGREWQLGYDKLPPLPWWLVEAAYRLFGHDVAFYALAQVAVIIAFVAVWATARPLVGAPGALVAVLIVDGLHYVHYTADKFNHDVIQLPFWALAGYAFHRALRSGRLGHWGLLGAGLGLALWAKYFVVVLALPLALFVLVDPRARQSLRTPGPYVAAAVALLIGAPHLAWLVQNDFLPFRYADARAAHARNLVEYAVHPFEFAASQLFFLLPALAIAVPLVWPRPRDAGPGAGADAYDRRIITVLAFGPAVTLLALSLATGRALIAMWGYPLWLFLGLWIVLMCGAAIEAGRLKRVVTIWAVVFVAFALAFIVNYAVLPRYDGRYRAAHYPGEQLAAEMSARFRAATGRPLAYVVSDIWTGGNVGHYAPERPRVLIDGDPRRAPWIDLGDLKRRGAVLVWTSGDPQTLPPAWREIAGGAQMQPPLRLPFRVGTSTLAVGWAILRPDD
jgi:4-amino-4-deoxy-L-arabinose transferase-like glycosyltransferase